MDTAVQYSGTFTYNLVGMQAFEFFQENALIFSLAS